jgi:hypothetical protein
VAIEVDDDASVAEAVADDLRDGVERVRQVVRVFDHARTLEQGAEPGEAPQ